MGIVFSLITMFALMRYLPLPSEHSGSLKVFRVIKTWPINGVFQLTVIAVTAHFTAYSYIEPLLLILQN